MEKKVLIIGPTNIDGGVGHVIMDMCRHMDLDVIKFDFMNYVDAGIEDKKIIEQLHGKFFLCPRYSHSPIKFYKWIKNFYEKSDYDIVHCNASTAMIFIYTFPIWKNDKVKLIVQSHNDSGKNKWLHYIIRKFIKKYADVCIGVSKYAGNWMFGTEITQSEKFVLLKNGIDVKKFLYDDQKRQLFRKKWGLESKHVIGNIGRFTEQKNHMFLLDVFYEISKKDELAVLALVGGGELEEKIKLKVQALNIKNKVFFLGTTDDIPSFLDVIDLFLFPSKWEGLGIVAIEAQTSGLPVLASTEVPAEAKITDNFYYLSLKSSAKEWAEMAIKLMRNGRKTDDVYNQIVNSGYDIQNTAKQLQRLYEET